MTAVFRSGFVRRLCLVLCLAVSMSGVASAAGWTIQTVALSDLREAEAVAADLESFGFDAYTEFAMWEGHQFVRVRFGCFATREIAETTAAQLRSEFVAEAVPVERTPFAPTAGCLMEQTGFVKPAEWRQLGEGAPAFEVTMANTTAVVRHTGRRWRITQADVPVPEFLPSLATRFRQGQVLHIPMVQTTVGETTVVVCPGTLLAEVGEVAIVDRGDTIVSCQLQNPAELVEAD